MKRLLALFLFVTPAGAQYFSSPPETLVNQTTTDATKMMTNFNRIVSDGNTTFNAFEAQIAAISGGGAATPAGAVVPFNLSACPSGWISSDGTAGTRDMRAYFARATGGSPAVGTFQAGQFVDHTHTIIGTYVTGFPNGSSANANSGGILRMSGAPSMTLGAPSGANVGSETRPKNVALLFCQKT
jgi:hypothetical protein